MPYRFSCPSCGEELNVAPSLRGQGIICRFCDQRVTVPAQGKSKKAGEDGWIARPFSGAMIVIFALMAVPAAAVVCCLGLAGLGAAARKPAPRATGIVGASKEEVLLLAKEKLEQKKIEDARRAEQEKLIAAQKLELEKARLEKEERLAREQLAAERERIKAADLRDAMQADRESRELSRKMEEAALKNEKDDLLVRAKAKYPKLRKIEVHDPVDAEQPPKNPKAPPVRGRLYWITGEQWTIDVSRSQFGDAKITLHFHVFVRDGTAVAWQKATGGYETVKGYEIVGSSTTVR
jgi:hypothetical protein